MRGRWTLAPVFALALAGAGGDTGRVQPVDVAPVTAVSLPTARTPVGTEPRSGSRARSLVLDAREQAVEALSIVAVGAAVSLAPPALYAASMAAVEATPSRCHLSPSILAALDQAAPAPPLGDSASSRDPASAVAATAQALCAHGRDLSRPADLRAALLARTGSPLIVQLVLTLKARYDLVGLGLVGAPGPVLVPLLLEQATALAADPYGPAVVSPSRPRRDRDGSPLPEPPAVARPAVGVTEPLASVVAQESASVGALSAVAAVPTSPADASGDGDGDGDGEPSDTPRDPGTDAADPTCLTDVVAPGPVVDPLEAVDPPAPVPATADVTACVAAQEPSVNPTDAATAAPEPTPETAATMP